MLVKSILALVSIYVALLLTGYLVQRRLLYVVDPVHVDPKSAGLSGVTETVIAAPDGARVLAWHGPAKTGQPTLLYFHGNAGSLAARAPRIERFMAEGWGVLMMTYRGYGGSTGGANERDNVADGVRAFDQLTTLGVATKDIVIYGESLGTGVATQVALQRPAAGLILDAPFTSIPDVGARRFWYVPVHRLMTDHYDTAAIIGLIKMPLLIIHGTLDRTVPVDMGRTLARLAPEPKTLVEFPNGGHSDLYLDGNDALGAVRAFLRTLPRRELGSSN